MEKMADLGQQTVEFSTLLRRVAEDSFLSLKDLVEKSKNSEQSDSVKKISLLKYIQKTRQRMLRMHVLAEWCQQVPLVQYCQQLASTLSSHDTSFTQCADSLFFMHEGLLQARAPNYDVPSAIEVLCTGTYQRLPKCVEDMGIQHTLTEDQQKPALKKLDTLLRSKLLEVSLPKEISEVKVSNGAVLLCVKGEFKVLLTLGYRGHLSMWRILHLELLVGERSGLVKLEESQRHALGDDLERRMAMAENPFLILYSILHELCVSLIMDTVMRQVQALRQGRWKGEIRFEIVSNGSMGHDGEMDSVCLKTPGLKILYWLDLEKSTRGSCPFIKIEPWHYLEVKCLPSTFVIDPQTGKEAELSLNQSCIDVEKLLLRVISCNRYTRLLELYRELKKNGQICQVAADVLLQCHKDKSDEDMKKKDNVSNSTEHGGVELLRVRAYGSSYITLGINIRSGHFFLQSSRNILTSSALLECEEMLNQGTMTAAEVFISLRSKSLLRLFASIGRFLGLKVYEQGLAIVKIPKIILNGSDLLLMGFPHCMNSYVLLMQLNKDFIPMFRLLETEPDPSGSSHSVGEFNKVKRFKNIDIRQMQMLEDELNLSLLVWEKLISSLPNVLGPNQTPEHGLLSEFGLESSIQIAGSPQSMFSSVVDEVFEVENRTLVSPLLGTSPVSHLGSVQVNHQRTKVGITREPSGGPNFTSPLYLSNNLNGLIQSSSVSSLPFSPGSNLTLQKLSTSKSDLALASLRSTHSVEVGSAMKEDQVRLLNESSKELVSKSQSSRLLSPLQSAGPQVSAPNTKLIGLKSSPTRDLVCRAPEAGFSDNSSYDDVPKCEKNQRKRSISNVLSLIPSLKGVEFSKRRRISESQALCSSDMIGKTEGYTYGNLLSEANKGDAPSSIYVTALIHVVRHCSLCIKHAQLTSQMDSLNIPYVEEVGLRTVSSNLWFQLPFSEDDSWKHICLRLGSPGNMYWDVKINDQHFKDLWELQKGSTGTPWGRGIHFAHSSDTDSHICYDLEGMVLRYRSVEADSIKRLVEDLWRLSKARLFSLGMRKLLDVRRDDTIEENIGSKGAVKVSDKISEQRRRAFRIDAVGLTSLWFSFVRGVLARFVVEWESGKEGCTMHILPDQLWPHTKFLENFINGAEVASLLDCIQMTAGPLHALAAATRPARVGLVSGTPNIMPSVSTITKQNGLVPSQGLLPSNPFSYATHPTPAMLAAVGRSGSGIIPGSLFPIDVSVVLHSPYWIRFFYRKDFSVDIRCFAGDQVWLQPATPLKDEGRTVGGSLPCPQFRPFIMEHIAQELNGIEANLGGGQRTVGLMNSNHYNPSSGSQLSVARPTSVALNRVDGSNHVSHGLISSSNLAAVSSGLPLDRYPGTSVPINVRGELSTAFIGAGDDGGYGGGWVHLAVLKKVLKSIIKYLGILWLFSRLPDLLNEILSSILMVKEGAVLNVDMDQPALRFFVGNYLFAVNVQGVQLILKVLSLKRSNHQQQSQTSGQEELSETERNEICEFFSHRVASEPYDTSRVASFITLLTLPISVLREFLKLIAWEKELLQAQSGELMGIAYKPRVKLCLENHNRSTMENSLNSSKSESNIHYDRPHNWVDFGITIVLDPSQISHVNVAGGAAWFHYSVYVRLRYSFGDNCRVSFIGMEGSHGGRACWLRLEEWEKCKQRVAQTVEMNGRAAESLVTQGRFRLVADSMQRTLQVCLKSLKDIGGIAAHPSSGAI